jgi:hypothetical protein
MRISQYMMDESPLPVFESNEDWTNTPSRQKFENLIQLVYGRSTPTKNLEFIVKTTDDKYFMVFYTVAHDKFLYEKLAKR